MNERAPRGALLFFSMAALAVSLAACPAPRVAPERDCNASCNQRVHYQCTENECERGCRMALDRLIEKKGDDVIACVARAKGRPCVDALWAECAAQIGPHADGGPPVTVPTYRQEQEDE